MGQYDSIITDINKMTDLEQLKLVRDIANQRMESLACQSFGKGSFALINIQKKGMGSHICLIQKAPGGRASRFNIVLLTEGLEHRQRCWRVNPQSLLPLPENRKDEAHKLLDALKKDTIAKITCQL